MITRKLSRRKLERGGVALAVLIGGTLAFGQVAGLRAAAGAAGVPFSDAAYFDHGWEVDNAPVAPSSTGTPSWDRGWEVDNASSGH